MAECDDRGACFDKLSMTIGAMTIGAMTIGAMTCSTDSAARVTGDFAGDYGAVLPWPGVCGSAGIGVGAATVSGCSQTFFAPAGRWSGVRFRK